MLYAEAPEELQKVAELLGAPVMTTLQGKSSFSETHELSAGVGAYVTTPMVAHYLREADVMLAVGSSLSLSPFTPEVPAGKTIIHATVDPGDINKEHEAAVPVVADAKLFSTAVGPGTRGPSRRGAKEPSTALCANHRLPSPPVDGAIPTAIRR